LVTVVTGYRADMMTTQQAPPAKLVAGHPERVGRGRRRGTRVLAVALGITAVAALVEVLRRKWM